MSAMYYCHHVPVYVTSISYVGLGGPVHCPLPFGSSNVSEMEAINMSSFTVQRFVKKCLKIDD
jgi:hypothetical protein